MSNPNLPTVTFTITRFHKIGGTNKYCEYTMALANGGNQVTLDAASKTLTVTSAQPLQLVFTADGAYLLAGITFKETSAGKSDPYGVAAFPSVLLELTATGDANASTLTITDAASSEATYEFALLVVGLEQKELGLIDPPIINKPPA